MRWRKRGAQRARTADVFVVDLGERRSVRARRDSFSVSADVSAMKKDARYPRRALDACEKGREEQRVEAEVEHAAEHGGIQGAEGVTRVCVGTGSCEDLDVRGPGGMRCGGRCVRRVPRQRLRERSSGGCAALWRRSGRRGYAGPNVPLTSTVSSNNPFDTTMAAGASSGQHGPKPLTPRQAFMKNWFAMEVCRAERRPHVRPN
jgi:hypothetical protein